MDIYDEKNKDVYVETLLHAQAKPRKGLFMDIQKKKFMNIYGSLMDIFDQTKREAQTKTFMTKNAKLEVVTYDNQKWKCLLCS